MAGIGNVDSALRQTVNDSGNTIANTASQPSQQGLYKGATVSLASSNLNDALEELTKSLSEKTEKDMSKRKIKDVMSSGLEQAERVQELLEAAFKVEKRDQLDQLVNDLINGKASQENLRERLRQFSGDLSEQYIALLEARQQLKRSAGNEIALQCVNQLIAEFDGSQGAEIVAGINALLPAKEAESSGIGDVSELRGFYQDSVLNYEGLSGAWNRVVEQYGESRLLPAIGFMLKALAADYEAAGSSIDKVMLLSIMKDMNTIKSLSACYDECEQTARIIDKDDDGLARKVMDQLLTLYDKSWATEDDIKAFIQALDIEALDTKIQVLISLKSVFGLITKDNDSDQDKAQNIIDEIQSVLNELTYQEEYGEHNE